MRRTQESCLTLFTDVLQGYHDHEAYDALLNNIKVQDILLRNNRRHNKRKDSSSEETSIESFEKDKKQKKNCKKGKNKSKCKNTKESLKKKHGYKNSHDSDVSKTKAETSESDYDSTEKNAGLNDSDYDEKQLKAKAEISESDYYDTDTLVGTKNSNHDLDLANAQADISISDNENSEKLVETKDSNHYLAQNLADISESDYKSAEKDVGMDVYSDNNLDLLKAKMKESGNKYIKKYTRMDYGAPLSDYNEADPLFGNAPDELPRPPLQAKPSGGIASIGKVKSVMKSGIMSNQWNIKEMKQLKLDNNIMPEVLPAIKGVMKKSRMCILNSHDEYCIGQAIGSKRKSKRGKK